MNRTINVEILDTIWRQVERSEKPKILGKIIKKCSEIIDCMEFNSSLITKDNCLALENYLICARYIISSDYERFDMEGCEYNKMLNKFEGFQKQMKSKDLER